jgi:hypothetical protein
MERSLFNDLSPLPCPDSTIQSKPVRAYQNPLPADSDVRATALEAILELGREISGS